MNMSIDMHDVTLVVKCLRCKKTYGVDDVHLVRYEVVTDPDTGDFVHYEVQFLFGDGEPVYLQDLLCLPKHCSVFGRTERSMFAFPCLAPMGRVDKWVSSPGRDGLHVGVREVAR